MSNINDLKLTALETLTGETGHIADLEKAWLMAEVGASEPANINDLWNQYLVSQGAGPGHAGDMMVEWLAGLGYSGALPDMLAAMWAAGGPGGGVTFSETDELVATTPQTYEHMGISTAMDADGNTLVTGAHRHDVGVPTQEGAVRIFVRSGSTWSQQQLIESPTASTAFFGFSVAISDDGNTIAVGAYNDDDVASNEGSVRVYTRSGSTWSLEQKIIPNSSPEIDVKFGDHVDLSGDGNTMVIGGAGFDNTIGAAEVWTRTGTTWTFKAKLQSTGAAVGDKEGVAVCISGDGNYIWVGAAYDIPNNSQGYVREWYLNTGTWTEGDKLVSNTPTNFEYFGDDIKLNWDGSYGFIGAYGTVVSSESAAGAFQVFKRTTGSMAHLTTIENPAPVSYGYYGWRMDIDQNGTKIVIGANGNHDGATNDVGTAYEYSRSGDTITYKGEMQRAGGAAWEYYGRPAVSKDGNYCAIGASDVQVTLAGQGAVYIWGP